MQSVLPWSQKASSHDEGDDAAEWKSQRSLWEQDPVWKAYVSQLDGFNEKLKIVELCGGLGTAFIALALLLPAGCLESAGHWDTDSDLARYLGVIHRNTSKLHLGGIAGDLMAWTVTNVALAHIIVAGPPCPPWSCLGRRRSFEDVRAGVFWQVIEIILYQANHAFLGLFVLENVEAIGYHSAGATKTPLEVILEDIREGLPDNWKVAVEYMNTLRFGLPQSRRRVYIIGHRTDLFGTEDMSSPSPFHHTVPLSSLLDTDVLYDPVPNTAKQAANMADWRAWFAPQIQDPAMIDSVAVFDISRTPSDRTSWAARGSIDQVECLTAAGPNLHVLSLGVGDQLFIDRRLRGYERARLQGFPPMLCDMAIDGTPTKRIFGNAMSVPVIGTVLATELIRLTKKSSRSVISSWSTATGPLAVVEDSGVTADAAYPVCNDPYSDQWDTAHDDLASQSPARERASKRRRTDQVTRVSQTVDVQI